MEVTKSTDTSWCPDPFAFRNWRGVLEFSHHAWCGLCCHPRCSMCNRFSTTTNLFISFTYIALKPSTMSEGAGSSSKLGKRARDGESTSPAPENVNNNGSEVPEMPPADMEDSSDDEIGPMPGGDIVISNGRKKKRTGEHVLLLHRPQTIELMTPSSSAWKALLGITSWYRPLLQVFYASGTPELYYNDQVRNHRSTCIISIWQN